MLNIEDLMNVKTIVTHADCPDGVASALILHDALPKAEIVFVRYNSPEHRELSAEPGMLFCDMTPPADRAQEFVDAGAIVLDHHRGARELVERFGERGVFADEDADPGVSGAMLAYKHVWFLIGSYSLGWTSEETAPYAWGLRDFAILAGIRDTWQRNHLRWREACAQAAALRFWPTSILLDRGVFNIDGHLEIGEVLLQKDEERDTRSIAEAHRFTAGGIRVVAFQGLHTSDIADRLEGEADLVLGWHYAVDPSLGQCINVSARSRGSVSALAFAKYYGGGGHTQAAGFKRLVQGYTMDPYRFMEALVRDWAVRA